MSNEHQSGPPTYTVFVFAPSQTEPKKFTWPQTKKVGEAAQEAAAAFGITVESPTFQNEKDEVLDRDKPLVAAHVRDGAKLELVSAGGGVFTVPLETTVATVEAELPALTEYAKRHSLTVEWRREQLEVRLTGIVSADDRPILLCGNVDGYRAVPPAWTFQDLREAHLGKVIFPRPSEIPGVGSIFHSSRLICAPFNRLAYKEFSGPHEDWGGPASWLGVRGTVWAQTLADMVAVITGHLRHCPGICV